MADDAAAPAAVPERPPLQYHDDRVFVGSFPEGTDMAKVEAVVTEGRTVTKFKTKTKVRKGEGDARETVENAFVTFGSTADAEDAIAKLNGKDFEGGTGLRVEFQIKRPRSKKPKKPRAEGAEGGAAAAAPEPIPANPCKIIVKALKADTTAEQVQEVAATHGEVEAVDLIKRGRPRCFVTYATPEAATAAAAAIDGVEINGVEVKAEMEAPRTPRAPKAKAARKAREPKPQDPTSTFVGDMTNGLTKADLLERIPGAANVRVMKTRSGPGRKEVTTFNAIVTFGDAADATALQAKNGTEIFEGSGVVRVEAAKPRGPR